MMKNKTYSNGQKTFVQSGDLLTYFFKNGKIKVFTCLALLIGFRKCQGIGIDGIRVGEMNND
jgi:hypothetical protein